MIRVPRSSRALSFGVLSLLVAAFSPGACTLAEGGAKDATGTGGAGATGGTGGTGGTGATGGTGGTGGAGGAPCTPAFDDCVTPGVDEDCDGDAPMCKGDSVGAVSPGGGPSGDEIGFGVATNGSTHVVVGIKNGHAFAYKVDSGELYVVKYKDDLSIDWQDSFVSEGGYAAGRAVALDSKGDIVVAGEFRGKLDILGTILDSNGSVDIFLAKFNADGTLQWAQDYGDDNSNQMAYGVAVNGDGDIFVTGQFEGDLDFGSGAMPAKGVDVFVAKIGPAGNGGGPDKWARRFNGDNADQVGWSIATTADGNVVVAGGFAGSLDFGGGPLNSQGEQDVFVAKLNRNNGDRIWQNAFGDQDFQRAYSVSVGPKGDIAVAGEFLGTIDAGTQISSNRDGNSDGFVIALAENGAPRWARRLGDGGDEACQSVSVDGAGHVLVSGHYEDSFLIGNSTLQSKGAADIYVAKLGAADGTPLWSRSFGSLGYERSWAVAADPQGNALVTGGFDQTVDFGPPVGSVQSSGATDLFLLELAP